MPEFWQTLFSVHPDFHEEELFRAHSHWQNLHSALAIGQALHKKMDQLLQSLVYFRAMDNPETIIFLREVVAHILPHLNVKPTSTVLTLIEILFEDTSEGLRLSAFPLVRSNKLKLRFLESSDRLLQTLRELTPRDKSPHYQVQGEAGQLIQKISRKIAANDIKELADDLKALRRAANNLNNHSSSFLSLDLQVLSYELGRHAGLAVYSDLYQITVAIRKIIAETNQHRFLPAPVQAAIARLNHCLKNDEIGRAFPDLQLQLQHRFGETHNFLFESPEVPAFEASDNIFPTDTLVVVYSCQKNIDTRVAAIRLTWIQDLKARGIPYLVLVGDGDDSIDGDVLALDVSDKYEDLPKKSLKLFDWILKNTKFQYVYKIDDDCYLDVSRFFNTLTYRKHFYYGRVVQRGIGSMDRTWHQLKSHTDHAKKTLDKSPEPSVYADGGGGYVLSRLAMTKLRKAVETEAGQRLIACSLMEDKLVGDLLALYQIVPCNEDYESYQRRRTFSDAVPVSMWENTFFPSAATPTVMTHMDNHQDMESVRQIGTHNELWPKKLWPTFCSADIKFNKNQLELLSDPKALALALQNWLHVVTVMRNEMTLLPHFLTHYRKLGIKNFFIVDNLSDDGTREYLLEQDDVILFSVDSEYKHSHYGVVWQQTILGNLCMGKWALLADADEFLVYHDCEKTPVSEYIHKIESQGFNGVRVDMIDMYPFGDLDKADFRQHEPFNVSGWFDRKPLNNWHLESGWFSNAINCTSNLRHRLDPNSEPTVFTSQKYALFRYGPWIRLSEGLHYQSGINLASKDAYFAHFKYHAGFKHKVETEIRRGQHFDNAKEYRRYAQILAEINGGFGDEKLSVRYKNSTSFGTLSRPKRLQKS